MLLEAVAISIVDDIYSAALDEEAMAALPGRLAAMVGARSASFQVFSGQTPISVWTSYFTAEMGAYYLANNLVEEDAWTALVTDLRLYDQAVDSDDHLSRNEFARGAFHNEFFRHFGDDTGVSLGAVLTMPGGMIGVGLHRAIDAPAYDPTNRHALNSVLPHLRRMVEMRGALTSAQQAARDMGALLHAQASAVLLVSADGRIVFANTGAEAILRAKDGLSARLGVLSAVGQVGVVLEAAMARAALGGGDALLVERPSGKAAYRLLISPHRGQGVAPGRAMVVIEDLSMVDPELGARLRRLYGFTAAEADLAERLLQGQALSEASEARGVMVSTGRSQLNSMLAKTGVRRQSELLAMLARTPGVRGVEA